jgi:uncharacterized protein YkwD
MMHKRLTTTILGILVLVGGLSGCSSSYDALKNAEQPLPPNSAPTSTVSQRSNPDNYAALEQSIYQQVNQYRKSRDLPPLTLDSRISEQSRIHSDAMASGRVPFSHNGFDDRVKALSRSIPYRSAAENVAYNQGYSNPGKQAVEGWIKSPGHRKNMEGNFNLTGIGVSKNAKGEYYFTQIFIKRR